MTCNFMYSVYQIFPKFVNARAFPLAVNEIPFLSEFFQHKGTKYHLVINLNDCSFTFISLNVNISAFISSQSHSPKSTLDLLPVTGIHSEASVDFLTLLNTIYYRD